MEFKLTVMVHHYHHDDPISRKLDQVLDHLHAQSVVLASIAAAVDTTEDQALIDAAANLKAKSDALAAQLAAAPK